MRHQKFWIGVFILLALVPFGMYFSIFHGELLRDSQEWANAGTFIYGFSIIALTGLNVYAMFAINRSLRKTQKNTYKLKLLYDFIDNYKDLQIELRMNPRNNEACVSCAYKAYHLAMLIANTETLFPSMHQLIDLQEYSRLISGLMTGIDKGYYPTRNNKPYANVSEIMNELGHLFDSCTSHMRQDIEENID